MLKKDKEDSVTHFLCQCSDLELREAFGRYLENLYEFREVDITKILRFINCTKYFEVDRGATAVAALCVFLP